MSTDYASTTELRNYLGMGTATAGTASTDDTFLGLALDAAALAIDQFCDRSFTTAGTAATTRYFTSAGSYLPVPDANGTAFMITVDSDNDGDWDTNVTDFTVVTRNANVVAWTEIRWGSTAQIPTQRDGIAIAALWGWSATPSAVKLATLIQASRYWKRKDSPFGSFGASEFGNATVLPWRTALDPDVQTMLQPYVRGWVAL